MSVPAYLTAAACAFFVSACGGEASAPALDLAPVNAARAAGAQCGSQWFPPVGPLTQHPALVASSQRHADDMAQTGNPDHVGTDGLSSAARAANAGYPYPAGENVAAGQPDLPAAVREWLVSPAHCANLMSPRLVHAGIGYAEGVGPWGTYWVLGVGTGPN